LTDQEKSRVETKAEDRSGWRFLETRSESESTKIFALRSQGCVCSVEKDLIFFLSFFVFLPLVFASLGGGSQSKAQWSVHAQIAESQDLHTRRRMDP
jgi:hypothetical protein